MLSLLLAACAPDPIALGVGGDGVLGGSVCELDKYGPDLEYLYVLARGSDAVTVVNPRSCTAFLEIEVGSRPVVANATASGAHVYVVNEGDGTVSVIDTEDNVLADTLTVSGTPERIRFDIPHQTLWTAGRDGAVSLIDVTERAVVGAVQVDPGPHHIAMREERPYEAWITSTDSDLVHVFDTETGEALRTVPVGERPGDLAWSSAAQQMAVCTAGGIDLVSDDEVEHVPLPTPCSAVEVDPTGRFGFVLRHEGTTLTVLDLQAGAVHAELDVGEGPDRIAFHDGVALVSGLRAATLSLVDLDTFEEIERVQVGDPALVTDPPRERELRRSLGDPDVFYLVSPYDGTLILYDVLERAVRGIVDVGEDPGDVMIAGPIGGSCC